MNMKVLPLIALITSVFWASAQPICNCIVKPTKAAAGIKKTLEQILSREGGAKTQSELRSTVDLYSQLIGPAFSTLEKGMLDLMRQNFPGVDPSRVIRTIFLLEGLISLLGSPENMPPLRTTVEISLNARDINQEISALTKGGDWFTWIAKQPRAPIIEALRSASVLKFLQSLQEIASVKFMGGTQERQPKGLILTPDARRFYTINQQLVTDLLKGYEDQVKDILLFFAVCANSIDQVKEYLHAGANPNCRVSYGSKGTALIEAISLPSLEIVTLLLAAGADINIAGQEAIGRGATEAKVPAITEVLKKHGLLEGWVALVSSAYRNNLRSVRMLLERGADPNQEGPKGFTALYFATKNGNTEMIELLKAFGATK